MRRTLRITGVAAAAVALVAVGVVLGRGLEVAEELDVHLVRWLADWSRSAGFGGVAAIAAATIAYRAARQNARRQEKADRKAQWWARAQWALDLTLSDDPHAQEVGFGMLDALANSEWADEHEGDVIAAATETALDAEEVDVVYEVEGDRVESADLGEVPRRDRPDGEDGSDSEQEV